MESTRDLQKIVTQAAGKPIELDPAESFVLSTPSLKITGEVEIRGHGAVVTHDRVWPGRDASFLVGPNVSGLIDGLTLIGEKDPSARGQVAKEGHGGLRLTAAHDLTISNVTIAHVAGDFLFFGCQRAGSKKKGLTFTPSRRVVLDNVHGYGCGRHRIAAVGVGYADGTIVDRGGNAPGVTDRGKEPGLIVKASCSFSAWRGAKTDIEFWNGYKTPKGAISDLTGGTK